MPELRTDDGPRHLRALWLGPKGMTLPFEWTYVQWAVVALLGAVFGLLFALVVWLTVGDLLITVAFGLAWGVPTGVLVGVRVMRTVTFDEPLRAKSEMLRSQFSRADRSAVPAPVRLEISFPPIKEAGDADRLWME